MTWPTSTAVASTEYATDTHYNNLRNDVINSQQSIILVTSALVGTLAPSTDGTPYLWQKGFEQPEAYTLKHLMDQTHGAFLGHRNIASGLTASQSGWATPPTNLANITDESLTVAAGQAVSTQTADDLAYIQLDLGATNTGLAFFKAVIGGPAGTGATGTIKFKHSVNGTAWTSAETLTILDSSTATVARAYALTGPRYLRLLAYHAGSGSNAYLTLNEMSFFLDYAAATAAAANTWSSLAMTTATAASGQTDRFMMMTLPATAPTDWYLSLMATSTSA